MLQGKCLRIVSPKNPAQLCCCYGVITVLTVAVVVLSVAITVRKTEQISIKNAHAVCPKNWIGFGKKCFHFSEYSRNWTYSQTFCMAQEAQLARFDNLEELHFLGSHKGTFDYWIGLHRESSKHPWKWTDNTEAFLKISWQELLTLDQPKSHQSTLEVNRQQVYHQRD
ncbi:C-type lectin domain family 2 member I [Apodemus speciosus]|uniref:C-type lectin domain family 2 member I n=1 Tax=Apodemus speciosus TaxID=105296 RepID=A0ABQ0EWC1_APOSI